MDQELVHVVWDWTSLDQLTLVMVMLLVQSFIELYSFGKGGVLLL
jgi:hypothetical protein